MEQVFTDLVFIFIFYFYFIIFWGWGEIMGPIMYLMRLFVGGEKKNILAQSLLKMLQKLGRPVTGTGKTNISKVRGIHESDDSYIICDIAKAVGISLSRAHFILKLSLKVSKSSARWIPYQILLTDEQNRVCVQPGK